MSRARLDWRSGGLLLGLALALVLAAVGWRVAGWIGGPGAAGGAGRTAAEHGFDVSNALVPAATIVPSGVPRDGIPALVDPPSMPAAEVAAINAAHRGKYIVGDDLVVGVVVGGEARAYPVRVLDWHEAVNDTVGGVPLLITRSPLSQAVAVYERRVDNDGDGVAFGVSGLLVQSGTLLYDRSGDGRRSLWSQLDGLALAGPRAGERLRALPASLARWSDWLARHPASRVLRPDEDRLKRYQRDTYGTYRSLGRPRFPVDPLPPPDGPAAMAPLLLVGPAGAERAWLLPEATPDRHGLELNGANVEIGGAEPPLSVLVEGDTAVRYAAWFAWFARRPAGAPDPLPWPGTPESTVSP